MSVGQYDSPKHFKFLQDEHYRQQDELNRNILDRLNTLENAKFKSFSSHNYGSSPNQDDIKENIREMANLNIDNLRKLEYSNRQNWEQLFDKMKNMEGKMLRMFRDKQQAMSYLDLRIGQIENSQKTVGQIMRKLMEKQNQKYEGVTLLEGRLKQVEHRFQLKDQRQSDNIKILQEQINLKISQKIAQIQRNFESTVQRSIGQSRNSSPVKNDGDIEELTQTIRMMQMEFKQNRRKVLGLEDKFGAVESDIEEIQEKIKKIQKQLQKQIQNIKNNNHGKNVDLPDPRNNIKIQEPLHKRGESSYRKKSQYGESNEEAPRSQFRGISEIRKASYQKSEPSEEEDPFQQANNMRGGIRGLLQKSKQKEQKSSHNSLPKPKASLAGLGSNNNTNQPKGLARQKPLAPVNPLARGSQKGLPPVKADPKLKNQQIYQASESEQEQQVYGVDEEGYLLDEQGNYIYNEYDERVQLSEEDFIELMKQQNG